MPEMDDTLHHITANGIDFAYFEMGSGPLALCLHGYPDTAYTWRHLLPELAAAGFRAVAPFNRGYAPTSLGSHPIAGDASSPRRYHPDPSPLRRSSPTSSSA